MDDIANVVTGHLVVSAVTNFIGEARHEATGFILDDVMRTGTGSVAMVSLFDFVTGKPTRGLTVMVVRISAVKVVTGFVVSTVMLVGFTVDDVMILLALGTVGRVIQCFASIIAVSGFIFDEVVTGLVSRVVTGFIVATIKGTVEKVVHVSGFAVIEATTVVSGFIFDNVVSELRGSAVTGFMVATVLGTVGRVVSDFTVIEGIVPVSGFTLDDVVSVVTGSKT